MRKPVFGVSDQVRTNRAVQPRNIARSMISDLGSRGIVLTKALISCAVLICAFVFAHTKSRFSHDEAHIMYLLLNTPHLCQQCQQISLIIQLNFMIGIESSLTMYSGPNLSHFLDVNLLNLSLVVRKPVFGVSYHVQHKPGCTATVDG